MRNKFESVAKYVGNNPDILTVPETKIDVVLFEGFPTFSRLDCTAKSGGVLFYVRGNIPSKYLKKFTVK